MTDAEDQDRELLRITEAADRAGVARSTIRRALDADKFPNAEQDPDDPRGTWLIPTDDLDAAGYGADRGATDAGAAGGATGGLSATQATPPGAMMVPVEAWEATLAQLANLHDAGERLAEARERAAKAETERDFLRERLTELRAAQDQGAAQPADVEDWWWSHPVALAALAAVLAAVLIAGVGWWAGWWS